LSRRTRGVWTLNSQKDRLTKTIHLEYRPLTYPYFFVYQVLNYIGASNCAFLTATCGAAAGREPGLLQAGNARSSRLDWHILLQRHRNPGQKKQAWENEACAFQCRDGLPFSPYLGISSWIWLDKTICKASTPLRCLPIIAISGHPMRRRLVNHPSYRCI